MCSKVVVYQVPCSGGVIREILGALGGSVDPRRDHQEAAPLSLGRPPAERNNAAGLDWAVDVFQEQRRGSIFFFLACRSVVQLAFGLGARWPEQHFQKNAVEYLLMGRVVEELDQ